MVGRLNTGTRRPTSGESSIEKIGAVAAIAVLVVLIGALFVWLLYRQRELASLDPDTFCPKSGPTSVTSVLIDRTDPLTAIQDEALRRYALTWAQEVPVHGAFRIYQVGYGGELLSPIVSVCNPGDGTGLSALDSNPAFWRRRYEQKFMTPIVTVLQEMRNQGEAQTSPILEGVQAISVRDFGPDSTAKERELIIVSDLLQNTERLSLYQRLPDIDAFARSADGRALESPLHGVSYSIYLLNRRSASAKQTNQLGEFWIHWLERQGATPSAHAFIPLPG